MFSRLQTFKVLSGDSISKLMTADSKRDASKKLWQLRLLPTIETQNDILSLWVAVTECCLSFCYTTTTTKQNCALRQSVSHSLTQWLSRFERSRLFSTKFRFVCASASTTTHSLTPSSVRYAAPENLFENFCGFYARP